MQRGKQFYENNWMMLHETCQELYKRYIKKYCNKKVSHGTFYNLKPFHSGTETEKDIEMCYCKLYWHARWVIEAIIKCAESQEIEVPFENYATFFNHLTQDCEPGSTAYINWVCTPSKKKFCDHIFKLW